MDKDSSAIWTSESIIDAAWSPQKLRDSVLPFERPAAPLAVPLNQELQAQILAQQQQILEELREIRQRQPPPPAPAPPGPAPLPPVPKDSLFCSVCGRKFSTHYRAVLHWRYIHKKETGINCKKCGKMFQTMKTMEEHLDQYHSGKNFYCTHCRKKGFDRYFEGKTLLKKHLVHSSKCKRSYQKALKSGHACQHCLSWFFDLKQHLRTCKHRPDKPSERFECGNQGCYSTFAQKKDRNYHQSYTCKTLPPSQRRR